MRTLLPLAFLLAVACRTEPDKIDSGDAPVDTGPDVVDLDGDGYPAHEDCDDGDASIHPGAEEICDGLDNDCDGLIDDGVGEAWYADADGDGYGDPDVAETACEAPSGFVADAGPGLEDCDDGDPETYPGAPERCDGLDNDCDGTVDEDLAERWYLDSDGDGFGDPGTGIDSCDPGEGWVEPALATDCDDGDAAVNPAAIETCNGIDDDCDGAVDEELESTWYPDADGDGFGDPDGALYGCEPVVGYVADDADCDDANSGINPDAQEVCDTLDNDCDGLIDDADDSVTGGASWYSDADGDGYGDDATAVTACEQPSGHSASGGDCDDGDAAYNPGAAESDCTDPSDYNCDGSVGWADDDGDGWAACEDCDDSDAAVNPDGVELCNGVDDDCDGTVDEADASDAGTWYADADGDGYGDAASTATACAAPSGYVADGSDCDDGDAAVSPAAAELCNEVDDDCDGTVDEADASDASTWYQDLDGDGYGEAAASTDACGQPSGYVADASDCDDGDAAVNPGANELCNGLDDDCDGTTDEADASDAASWYQDLDGDSYGDAAASTLACSQPSGYVADASDCDDGAAAVNPAASEVCNGVDDDCDGSLDEDDATDATAWYLDGDGDGYGDASDSVTACAAPTGYTADATDCDDAAAAVNPGASEVCNGVDDDCDGATDDDDASLDATSTATWYADGDSDGYGDAGSTTDSCSPPSGYVADATDCDDGDSGVHPGATETCDGVDQDCSGTLSWLEVDADGDGLLTCELSLWLRSDGVSNNDPAISGAYGSSEAAALLAIEGLGFDTASLASTSVTASLLDDYGLLVMNGTGDYGPLDASEAAVLEQWVRDGGSLLYVAYHPYESTCDMVDSLPAAFGLGCADYSSYWSGTATSITAHALTSEVSSIVGMGGEHWAVTSPTLTLADYGGWPVLTALELDGGRVVGVADEWFLYDSGSGAADIAQGDNEVLVENIWAWLADFAL